MSRVEPEQIRVLHVDDDADLAELVALYLQDVSDAISVETATSARDGLDYLGDGSIDCVVSDLEMPGMDGLEFLEVVREDYGDLPFVLFTGKGSEEVASDAIAAGVTEYLQKGAGTDQYEVLAHRIEHAVAERRAREEAAESERMFATLVENLPGMVYRCRVETGWPMEYVSDGCEALTGYEPQALEAGEVIWGEEIIHPDDRERVWEPVEAGIDAGESFEVTYRIVTSDDQTRWVWERGSPVREDDEIVALEGFISDVTEKRRREDRLAAERAVTEHALNALEDGFYVVEYETGDLLRWNDRVADVTGYSDAELESMTIFDLVPDEAAGELMEFAERATKGEESFLAIDALCKDGSQVPLEVTGSRIEDEDGTLIGISGIARDVSSRRRSRERLEEFARMASHDLRNPLHVVQARSDLARQTGDLDHLDAVTAAAERIDALIDDLRTLALEGATVGDTERVDLAMAARAAWREVQTGSATLEIDDPGTVEADPERLESLLGNLFRNAAEHGRGDTRSLTLEEAVERADDAPTDAAEGPVGVRVGSYEDGFYVADDGCGIPTDDRDLVFDHGYSTSDGGTGLGLPIVQSIADAHGWSIAITESERAGARFEIST